MVFLKWTQIFSCTNIMSTHWLSGEYKKIIDFGFLNLQKYESIHNLLTVSFSSN